MVSWRPLWPHMLLRPVREPSRFFNRALSSCFMYSAMAAAIADASFSFFFNVYSHLIKVNGVEPLYKLVSTPGGTAISLTLLSPFMMVSRRAFVPPAELVS